MREKANDRERELQEMTILPAVTWYFQCTDRYAIH